MSRLLHVVSLGCVVIVGVAISSARGDEILQQRSNKPQAQVEILAPAETAKLAGDFNGFGVGLYHASQPPSGNFAVSPYSVTTAFGLLYGGARAETAKELATVLRYPPGDRVHPLLSRLQQHLAARVAESKDRESGTPATLNVDNKVWCQLGYKLQPAYLDLLAEYYGAGVLNIDFRKPAEAVATINAWVSENTQKRIPKLLDAREVPPDTRVMLTNTVYFLARWADVFDKRFTKAAPFHLLDGTTIDAPLMTKTSHFATATVEGGRAIQIDYAGRKLSMLVLLPDEGKFGTFDAGLDAGQIAKIVASLKSEEVWLKLPKFTFSAHSSLTSALQNMGMKTAFTASADFSGISAAGEPLYVGSVIHEVFVKVDEEGTEAAAATAIGVRAGAARKEPTVFTVDRPFLFAIRENESGLILFMGRVVDPR